MKLKWYINRLKIMSFKEIIFFRIPQQLQLKLFGKFHQHKKFKENEIHLNPNFSSPNFLTGIIDKKNYSFDNFKFYNSEVNLYSEIDWLKDYKNNISSSKRYYAKIDRQAFNEIGDIKYVCEPSRFYFLPFLALTSKNDNSHISIIEKTLKNWISLNPYLNTIHWTSGIEIGIRSINLIHTHIVLSDLKLITSEIDKLIKRLIQYNYHFLKNHLSLYSSANNHLVAELAGLVCISSYFDNYQLKKSRKKWAKKLFNEIEQQINDDGVHMELSTHYHAEITDHFFNALMFLKRINSEIPQDIAERFKKVFRFLSHVEYDGIKTLFGDNDEGYLIYPYFDKEFSIYESLLQSSDLIFGTDFNNERKLDYRNYLIFGNRKKESTSKIINKKDEFFETSGYAFLYDNDSNVKLSIDTGNIGDKLSAAHGHSDILHFTLDIKGSQILMDSGTYQYHKKYENWRTYFRSVKAHNTISINEKNQATINSRMSWIDLPIVKILDSNLGDDLAKISAQHNAFKALGIIHQREFIFDKKTKTIKLFDRLKKNSKIDSFTEMTFYLNFNPKLEIDHDGCNLNIINKSNKISIYNPYFTNGQLIGGDEINKIGWLSKSYDNIEKGITFQFKKEINSSGLELKTEIYYGKS